MRMVAGIGLSAVDQGTPYEFDTAEKLLEDFFKHIDKALGAIK